MTAVHVQATGRRIAPFDDAPGDVLIANRPLSAWQAEAFAEAGLTPADTLQAPCVVVPDTLFTTGAVLARLVDGAQGRNAVLGLRTSLFGERTARVQPGVVATEEGWRFEAVRFVSGGDEPATVVWIDPEEEEITLKLPMHFEADDTTRISLPRHPIMTVHHWVHILWANQAAGAVEVRRVPRWRSALRILWAVVRALSFNRWKVLARLNTVGRGCDIHPTAVIEGSTLGDGVTVGAYARVLFSRVGDGATILPGAQVEVSTIGPGATVAQQVVLRLCVLYPQAFAGQQTMQATVIGRRTLTTLGSYSIDMNFDRTIRVPLDGALHDTGTHLLGAAFGHGCTIGTGFWLASGRAIPNHTVLIRDPDTVIARVPEAMPDGPWVPDQGGVRRLHAPNDPSGSRS